MLNCPGVIWTSKNYILTPAQTIPNDPDFSSQWNLHTSSYDWDINAPEAWDHSTGGPGLYDRGYDNVVSVLDGGFDMASEEILPNKWLNLPEFTGVPGQDDDLNGYVDDDRGWDVVTGGDYFPATEDHHGNQVMSCIAAVGNNEERTSGVNWKSRIMPVNISDQGYNSTAAWYQAAMDYVYSNALIWYSSRFNSELLGSRISAINLSWTVLQPTGESCDCGPNSGWSARFDQLAELGIIFTAAGKNVHFNMDPSTGGRSAIPGSCCPENFNLLTVTMTNRDGFLHYDEEDCPGNPSVGCCEPGTNEACGGPWGEHTVDLAAPGVEVPVLGQEDWLSSGIGCSYAAPQVAGAIALLRSVPNPCFSEFDYISPEEGAEVLVELITSNVKPWSEGSNRPSVHNGILRVDVPVKGLQDWYQDQGHHLWANNSGALFPSSNSNYVFDGSEGSLGDEYYVHVDNQNVIYTWQHNSTPTNWRKYLLSRPRSATPEAALGTGHSPCIAVGKNTQSPQTKNIYVAWTATELPGEGYDSIKVLQHKITNIYQDQEWRVARLGDTQFEDESLWSAVGVTLTAPVMLAGNYTGGTTNNPVVLVGVSGNAAYNGIHLWRAPSHDWKDYQEWEHFEVSAANLQDVTTVAAYRTDASNIIDVVWSNNDNEIHYQRGEEVNNTITWVTASHSVLSEGLTGVSLMNNVTCAYSRNESGAFTDMLGCFAAWEGTDDETNTRDIYMAQGRYDGILGAVDWDAPRRMVGFEECLERRSPSLHAWADYSTTFPRGVCPIGIAYERQYSTEPIPMIELRGLAIDFDDMENTAFWIWGEEITRPHGRFPTLSSFHRVVYCRDASSGPFYAAATETVPLTYPDDPPPPPGGEDEIDGEVVWYPPLTLDRSIVINPGGNLVLQVNTAECADAVISSRNNDVRIVIEPGGVLTVTGNSTKPIVLKSFHPDSVWGGIDVNTGGSLEMNYVEMKDCSVTCVKTMAPAAVDIENCTFYGTKMGTGEKVLHLEGSPSVTQVVKNCIVTDVPAAYGLYASTCDVEVENLTVEGCDYANSYIKAVTGNFRTCTFRDKATQHAVSFVAAGNTPNFQCCTFENLGPLSGSLPYTINAYYGPAPSFGYSFGTAGASNVITDECSFLMRMIGIGVKPIIANPLTGGGSGVGGFNDWTQNLSSGKYINWQSSNGQSYLATRQWWDRKPLNINDFYPSDPNAYIFGDEPADDWGICASPPASSIKDDSPRWQDGLDDFASVYDSLYAVAMGHEIEREYDLSQALFRQIAEESDDYNLAWQAMTHAASNQRFLQGDADGSWIPGLIDSLSMAAPEDFDYDTDVYAERLKGNYYLSIGNYETAINTLADLLETDLTESDSLYVSLELLNVYVLSGLESGGGGLDNVNVNDRIPQQLRVASVDDAWLVEQGILARLETVYGNSEPTMTTPIPTEFRLYQNYPNPFNPTTQIEFDLPEAVRVTLRVFNTLGQEVTTVNDAMYPAGHHVATWNGKSNTGADAATGLYIYQLKAGAFTDTKKMVLMR